MDVISDIVAQSNFKDVMHKVCEDHSPVIITGQNESPVVMMSLEDYNAIQETLYLMRSPKNAARLMQSIHHAESGNYQPKKLIEE